MRVVGNKFVHISTEKQDRPLNNNAFNVYDRQDCWSRANQGARKIFNTLCRKVVYAVVSLHSQLLLWISKSCLNILVGCFISVIHIPVTPPDHSIGCHLRQQQLNNSSMLTFSTLATSELPGWFSSGCYSLDFVDPSCWNSTVGERGYL